MSGFVRSTALLFSMHLGAVLRSRRALVGVVLGLFPPLIAWLGVRFGPDVQAGELLTGSTLLSLQFVVPILALVAGSAVITEEIENRTITYVFTRPISRTGLLFGRWLATLVLISILLGASAGAVLLVAATTPGEIASGLPLRYVGACLVGGAVYSLLFAVIGVFLKRSMILGLAYVFALEVALANIPGSSQTLSIQFYLRGILVDPSLLIWRELRGLEGALALETLLTPASALTTLGILGGIAALIGALGIRRRQYVLTS